MGVAGSARSLGATSTEVVYDGLVDERVVKQKTVIAEIL
jgi:hypothetical protein